MREQEPQYKKCWGYCNGKGWYYLRQDRPPYLPRFIKCEVCKGAGVVEMSEDEILLARDAARDHEADLRNDR